MKLGWVRPLVVLVSAGLPASVVTAAFAFQGSAQIEYRVRNDFDESVEQALAALKMAPIVLADAAQFLQRYDLRHFTGVTIKPVGTIDRVRLRNIDGVLTVELPIPSSKVSTSFVIKDLEAGLSRMNIPIICRHISTRVVDTPEYRGKVCNKCGKVFQPPIYK